MVYKQGRTSKHFDNAKLFLVMAGLLLIVFVYWYVSSTYISASNLYNQSSQINKKISYNLPLNSVATKTFGDKTDICTFNYPARWLIKTLPSNSIWHAQLSPIELSSTLGGAAFLNVSPLLQTQATPAESISNANFYNLIPLSAATATTINGYTVYNEIYQDPTTKWTFSNYYFFDKNNLLELSFVDSIPKDVNGIMTTLKFSKYTAEENAILSSLQINL